MIALSILPQEDTCVDIYNIQNVKNRCVVEHLLKEIQRVKSIMANTSLTNEKKISALNSLSNLCEESSAVRDILRNCANIKTQYVETNDNKTEVCLDTSNCPTTCVPETTLAPSVYLDRLLNVVEYDAYYNGTSLTLVKKSLKLCPEVKIIPCVESIVMFFEHNGRRLINVNVNLGGLVTTFAEFCTRKTLVQKVVVFLNQYKDCGEVIMTGALGDIDYDMNQLLLKEQEDEKCCEVLQTLNLENNANVPSDLPCDPCDPLYDGMKCLLKTTNADCVPYTWLLQYLRLQKTKSCPPCDPCDPCTPYPPCPPNPCNTLQDCLKCPPSVHEYITSLSGCDRGVMRQPSKNKCEEQPTCVPKEGVTHSSMSCVCKCVDKCKITYKICECKEESCKMVCVPAEECNCKDKRFLVTVPVCKEQPTTSCCSDCKKANSCCDDTPCPEDECLEYCDTVSILKRELCLYNTMNKVCDVTDRYTCFVNHVNKCLEEKYPKGLFQARTMCHNYIAPTDNSRRVDNNSELLALDHILVSECLKYYVSNPVLSDLCLVNDCECPPQADECDFTDYNIRAFFTGRVYCVDICVPFRKAVVDPCLGGQIYGLGLESFWNILRYNTCLEVGFENDDGSVNVGVFSEFNLDKDMYFIDFFYNVVRDCDGKVITCEERNDRICEDEFYRHLLCILTHIKCREEFIVIIAVMEAIYRAEKIGMIEAENAISYVRDLFSDIVPSNVFVDDIANNIYNCEVNTILQKLTYHVDNLCTTVSPIECSTTCSEVECSTTCLAVECSTTVE
jgi:hypothetical protein